MKYFEASIGTVVKRFCLMMAIALIAGFAGIPWLGVLCLPILLSAMLAVKFEFLSPTKSTRSGGLKINKTTTAAADQAA